MKFKLLHSPGGGVGISMTFSYFIYFNLILFTGNLNYLIEKNIFSLKLHQNSKFVSQKQDSQEFTWTGGFSFQQAIKSSMTRPSFAMAGPTKFKEEEE